MGVVASSVSRLVVRKTTRKMKTYNIQNRAEKVWERQKTIPNPAPKHPSTEKLLQKHAHENPQIKQEVERKDLDTIARMNTLKLEVTGQNPEIKTTTPDRPLPQGRYVRKDPMELSEKPESVPLGKLSLVQSVDILNKHKKSPVQYNAKVIAKEYSLDLDETYCLLKYFYSLDMEDNQLVDLSAVQQSRMKKMLIYTPAETKTKA